MVLGTFWKILFFSFYIAIVKGETCDYYDAFGNYQSFYCPGLFDFSDESYCCGTGSSQRCCDYNERYPTASNIGGIIGGVIVVLIVIGAIVACSICCCVASCPLYQRRHNGRVIHGGRTAIVVTNTQTVNTVAQPRPQVYPTGQQVPPPTNYTGQPQPPPSYGGPANYGYQQQPQSNYGNPQQTPHGYAQPGATYPPPPAYAPPQDAVYPPAN